MAGTADPSWNAFFDFIDDYRGIPPAELSAAFGRRLVSTQRIRDWRRAHGRPQLAELPRLSTAWTTSDFHNGDVDELFFARMVGAVPDSDSAAQETWLRRRVFELRQELRDLEMTVRNSDTTESTGAIVAAATATAQWAVAVSPSIEGPTDLPFHVADVLDFTSLGSNGARLTLEGTLNKTFVRYGVTHTPSAPSSWPVDRKKPPRPVERHRYSVRHTLAERSPDRSWPHERVPSVAVVHLTNGSWGGDVAAVLARMLGYGFFTVPKHAHGYLPKGRFPTPAQRYQREGDLHSEYLTHPWPRYVWSHRGVLLHAAKTDWGPLGIDTSSGRFLPRSGKQLDRDGPLHVVWLQETQELLDGLAEGFSLEFAQRVQLKAAQEQIQRQEAALQADHGVRIHIIECDTVEVATDGSRAPRWDRTFRLAHEAADQVLGGDGMAWTSLMDRADEIASKHSPDPLEQCLVDWIGRVSRTI